LLVKKQLKNKWGELALDKIYVIEAESKRLRISLSLLEFPKLQQTLIPY